MRRNTIALAAGMAVVGVATLIPETGLLVIGPAAALVVGLIAAWSGARAEDGSLGSGVRASLWAGLGALVGTALVVSVLAVVLGGDASIQELVRTSEPHPEARIPYEWIQPIAAATGLLVGILVGIENLVTAAIGGLVGAVVGGLGRGGYHQSPAH